MIRFATSSSSSVPRKMMRSRRSREKMSYPRSPRLERSARLTNLEKECLCFFSQLPRAERDAGWGAVRQSKGIRPSSRSCQYRDRFSP